MLKVMSYAEPRNTLRIKLVEDDYGVHVVAVDENGEPLPRGYLVSFGAGNKLILHGGCNPDLGLDLDEKGVIKTMVR